MNVQQAAQKAINLGKQFKAVIEIGEFLEELGSYDRVLLDAKNTAEKAQAETISILRDQGIAETLLKQTRIEVENQKTTQQALGEEAKKVAAETVQKAKVQAANLVAKADAAVSKTYRDMEGKFAVLQNKHDLLQVEVAELEKTHAEINQTITALKRRFV